MRILIRIVFVIFIANRIDCLGGVCDNCCDCFKEEIKEDEKEEIAISLINTHWYNVKKNNLVLKIFVKEGNGNVFISTDNKYKISIKSDEEGNHKISYQDESEQGLNLEDKKYVLFEIKTQKEEETVYLYCSNVEIRKFADIVRGIFASTNHVSITVIACDIENARDVSTMFSCCNSLKELDLKRFDTKNVTNMAYMFSDCSSLTKLELEKNFNTENVTNMNRMFSGCSNLENLNLNNFNTKKVTYMRYMFCGCSSLTELKFGDNFNTENVMYMSAMFWKCSSLKELDLQKFNTTNVMNMEGMFSRCSGLENLNLNNFNTEKVTNMRCMFLVCISLGKLEFGKNFNTTEGTNVEYMFRGCQSFPDEIRSNLNDVEGIINFFKEKNN